MSDLTRDSYEAVAKQYADALGDELRHKPLDRALLVAFAEQVPGERRVWDAGCGPGHVTAFLAGAGVTAAGVDLSDGMVAQARERHPGLEFVHLLDDADVRVALREFRRVPQPVTPPMIMGGGVSPCGR